MHYLTLNIHTYWHAGTGRGAGPDLDAVVFLTPEGLPCLPGRTVKGLVRDGMARAEATGAIERGSCVRWLGSDPFVADQEVSDTERREAALEAARFLTTRGRLRFGTAELGRGDARDQWRAWALARPREAQELRRSFASTRIDERGIAQDKTLRAVEVAVPMTLHAPVSPFTAGEPEDQGWQDAVKSALRFVDALGSHRNRGFGRVTATLEDA